jgi:hypothetical protein
MKASNIKKGILGGGECYEQRLNTQIGICPHAFVDFIGCVFIVIFDFFKNLLLAFVVVFQNSEIFH